MHSLLKAMLHVQNETEERENKIPFCFDYKWLNVMILRQTNIGEQFLYCLHNEISFIVFVSSGISTTKSLYRHSG